MANKPYIIIDNQSKMVLEHCINMAEAMTARSTYASIGYSDAIIETAAIGSTGSSSIATNRSGDTNLTPLYTIKEFMNNFNNRIQNGMHGKKVKDFFITIDESFDLENVFSRLAGMERTGKAKKTSGVTFGIEDDDGNIMKVTVEATQATAFEQAVARYLADIKLNVEGLPPSRNHKNISMAELLFKMKDQFQIIDVDFPKIPDDVIYNVDDASYKTNTPHGEDNLDRYTKTTPLDLLGTKDTSDNPPESGTAELMSDDDADESDSESVENFEDQHDDTEKSILKQVIDMLKSQAESDIEKAKAEAEKAKAEQARYTAQATQFAIKNKEDELRYQMQVEEEKRKQKEAKYIEDIAKRRLSDTVSTLKRIGEADDGTGLDAIMRERQAIMARYVSTPGDSPETRTLKTKQQAEAIRDWNLRYQEALKKSNLEASEAAKKRAEANKEQTDATKTP